MGPHPIFVGGDSISVVALFAWAKPQNGLKTLPQDMAENSVSVGRAYKENKCGCVGSTCVNDSSPRDPQTGGIAKINTFIIIS